MRNRYGKHDIAKMAGRIATCLALAKRDPRGLWTADRYWYGIACDYAERIGIGLNTKTHTVVGFMSALSPRNNWESQLKHTPVQLKAALQGLPVPHEGTGDMKRKAKRIADGEDPMDVLGGTKVRAFYLAILSRGNATLPPPLQGSSVDEDVVVDVHAWAVATGKLDGIVPVTGYRAASRAYHVVANAASMPVHHVQAVCWAQWRRTKSLEV